MALPADSYHKAEGASSLIGVREDLSDIIYDISPMDTAFMTAAGRGKASNTIHEWQTHELAAAASAAAPNVAIEGDDATNDTPVQTVRLENRTQIMDKVVQVTRTVEATRRAGRANEMAQQMFYRMRELKRDLEGQFCQNPPRTISSGTGARKAAGFETWIHDDNSVRGAGGADTAGLPASPTDTAQPTDGTQVDITEDKFKSMLQKVWTKGGDASLILAGPVNKQKIDGFAGNATPMVNVEGGVRMATFSVYVSPFGRHKIVPSRYVRERSVLGITPEYVKIAYLRPFQSQELAITGDSRRRQIVVEATLEMCNPNAHGIVADLTTT